MNSLNKTVLWVTLFAVAMGFLESSVVIYLRELYYPNGFSFPLKPIPLFVAKVEFFREAATVIMLIGCGILAGKTRLQRFAFFVLSFAIWDLFYYVFLYLCLKWPQSLADWDILFLIPLPWVGPVWAPCLLSLLMITGACYIIFRSERNKLFKISKIEWFIMVSGSLVCILSFMWDYLKTTHDLKSNSPFQSSMLFSDLQTYIPDTFNSALFFTGFLAMSSALLINNYKTNKK